VKSSQQQNELTAAVAGVLATVQMLDNDGTLELRTQKWSGQCPRPMLHDFHALLRFRFDRGVANSEAANRVD
jgi:hypothetical protein